MCSLPGTPWAPSPARARRVDKGTVPLSTFDITGSRTAASGPFLRPFSEGLQDRPRPSPRQNALVEKSVPRRQKRAPWLVREPGRFRPKVRGGPVSRVLSGAAIYLLRTSPSASSAQPEHGAGHTMVLLFAFAPDGACQAAVLPRRWWSLTPPFQLFPLRAANRPQVGVFFSAALSVGLPRLAVSQHPALWSPDFPHGARSLARPAVAWPTSQGGILARPRPRRDSFGYNTEKYAISADGKRHSVKGSKLGSVR